jgi:hypothetical protein
MTRLVPYRLIVIAMVLVTIGVAGCRSEPPAPPQGPPPANDADVQTLQDFQRRVDAYVALHRQIEARLPHLSKEATPLEIDRHQRQFLKEMAQARADAKQGDLFTPDMQRLIHRHFDRLFSGKDGAAVRASVMDENPLVDLKLIVNERYPDEVPLSTMPPETLQLLPKMPEELEYRFVGKYLVIMDAHAHLIADFVPNAVP